MKENSRPKHKFISYPLIGSLLITVAAAATLFATGYFFGQGQKGALVDYLKEQTLSQEKEIDRLSNENSALKGDLRVATEEVVQLAKKSATLTLPTSTDVKVKVSTVDKEEIIVSKDSTESAFEGKLFISLLDSSVSVFGISGYMIDFQVGAQGKSNKIFNKGKAGDVVSYEGYTIRVMSIGLFSARFLITKEI